MSVIFVLLPVALLFAAAALGVFIWAALSGQYDDVHTPAVRILHDDDPAGHDDDPAGHDDDPAGHDDESLPGPNGSVPEGARCRPI